jgi:hypothetical protein
MHLNKKLKAESTICNFNWNCTLEGHEPDWNIYDGIELGSCYNENDIDSEGSHWMRFDDGDFTQSELNELHNKGRIIHTLYGHLTTGGVEAIHDCQSASECRTLADQVNQTIIWEKDDHGIFDLLVEVNA